MSRNGAEGDEMAFLSRPTPEDADLAEFARSLRATLVSAPPVGQAATIVPRLAEEARIAYAQGPPKPERAERRSGPRLKTVGQLALGFCLVPLVTAGLAAAGVKLPEPAQSAFESVGIDLPNQEPGSPSEAPSAPPPAAAPSTDAPASTPATKPKAAGPKPGRGRGKAKAKGKGKAQGQPGQGQAQAPGQSGAAGSNGNGNSGNGNGNGGSASPGKSGSAPGHNKTGGSAGSGGSTGNGVAVGQTGATPPGHANKPASPGNSVNAPGKVKVEVLP